MSAWALRKHDMEGLPLATISEPLRVWQGPALFSYGFRPFFLGATIWAALIMVVWIAILKGAVSLPTAFDPTTWHAHEFLFGYLSAVIAGFLLTAVPNWTGRQPVRGWPLAALVVFWLAGRVGITWSASLPAALVAMLDVGFPLVLGMVITREIVAARNWRNLIVLGSLVAFILGNAVFHLESASGIRAAGGMGMRIGLAAVIMMIAIIGGRIVPLFTRNWLNKRGETRLPVPPMQRFDVLSLLILLVALVLWAMLPDRAPSGVALVLSGMVHVVRLSRWKGQLTTSEPLVLVLHVAYAFVPAGALATGAMILISRMPGLGMVAAQHLWTGGAIGLMTLAVMTRASLGHTGRTLTAGTGTVAIYVALVVAVLSRVAVGFLPTAASQLYVLSGSAWIAAFAGYVLVYGPLLLRARLERKD